MPPIGGVSVRRAVQVAAGVAGGALLLAATFLPWAPRGTGSSIAANRLADLLLSGTVDAWAPAWLGFCIYLVPVAGALLFIGCGLGGRAGVVTALAGLVPAAAVTVATVAALPQRDPLDIGTGAALALVGLALGAVSTTAAATDPARHLR